MRQRDNPRGTIRDAQKFQGIGPPEFAILLDVC